MEETQSAPRPVHVSIALSENPFVSGNEKMADDVAYQVTKVLFEQKAEIVAVHKEAESFNLANQLQANSPVPFHPGALKYYAEKGIKVGG